MKILMLLVVVFVSNSIFSQEERVPKEDSIQLISQIKNKTFKIEKNVFGDCIIESLKAKNSKKCSKSVVRRNLNKIFDFLFYKRIKMKDYSLTTEIVTTKISQRRYILVIKESEGEFGGVLRLYWFDKKGQDFYFVGLTCAG